MKKLCLILGLLMLAMPGYAENDGKSSDSANTNEVINPDLWKKTEENSVLDIPSPTSTAVRFTAVRSTAAGVSPST